MNKVAPEAVKRLVFQFKKNLTAYMNSKYNETQLRREFLDGLFEALGWDVTNKNGTAEQYKEVIHEDSIKIDGVSKAPDYCFRVGSERKFFVEAKKPSVNVKDDPMPAYQLRRYAWSAKLPLSIVTNFREIAVYDCRFKPNPKDKASVGRILYMNFEELLENWGKVEEIFSRDSLWQGSFDKYAEEDSSKKGTSEVDSEFLKELEVWRELLAKSIASTNKGLNQSELNFAVQRTLDRLLFFRISEDRGLEKTTMLKDLLEEKDVYSKLCKLFIEADDKYNSGLFHFKKENDRPTPPDELSLKLKIDGKVLKQIIEGLYYPQCPYEFSVISVEILGQVYEQFLGKEIVLTGNKVTIKDKPLVKKAGGVFYTPAYIVNKIVEDTIGAYLRNKKPSQVSKLRVLDPACGSGSFLIGAYDYILKWHLDWYLKNPTEAKDKLALGKNGKPSLTTQEKKRILLNNIYGVDIDAQAVETTKLSLYLKVLEGESLENVEKQLSLFRERALPDIGDNIKCGNSLVDQDIETKNLSLDEVYKINPFNWEKEYPEVFKGRSPGFDFIIGNPPYLRVQGLNEFHGNEIAYYSNKFKSAVKRFDMYLLFAEKSYSLLNPSGELGFICPHKFIIADFGEGIRDFLVREKAVSRIISFDYNLIFDRASTYTCLLYLTKKKNSSFKYIETPELKSYQIKRFLDRITEREFSTISYKGLTSSPWTLTEDSDEQVFQKVTNPKGWSRVEDIFNEIMVGVQTGIDDIHIVKFIKSVDKKSSLFYSYELKKEIKLETDAVKPFLMGDDIKRYDVLNPVHFVVYPYKLVGSKTVILEEKEFQQSFPKAFEYMSLFKKKLKDKRTSQKTNPKYWYSCHRPKDMNVFESERILMPYANLGCNLTLAPAGAYHNTKAYSLTLNSSINLDPRFYLAFMNSDVMWWYQTKTGNVIRGGYYTFTKDFVKNFPLPVPNLSKPAEKKTYDEVVSLVDKILQFKEALSKQKAEADKIFLSRQIDQAEQQIEKHIYQYYSFTETDIKVIKSKSKSLWDKRDAV